MMQMLQVILEPMASSPSSSYFYFEPGVIDYLGAPDPFASLAAFISGLEHIEATMLINNRANQYSIKLRGPQGIIKLR